MKSLLLAGVFAAGYCFAQFRDHSPAADTAPAPHAAANARAAALANPAIDMDGYLKVAREAADHRKTRRVTEAEFIKMSEEEGTVVLDARSKEMFDRFHLKGAINLSFPNMDMISLPKLLPDKNARILIYCNNNFTPAAIQAFTQAEPEVTKRARETMRPKMAMASLNISTYIALYTYGYKNVYELAPLIDPAKSKLAFEPAAKRK